MSSNLKNGNCLDVLKSLSDNSIDSIVTDPPYGLSFMGKRWDYDVPSVDIWKECLRVLKPGGHLLAFGGTRTYHRLAVNIEDAGFEIRDQVQWIYGSGFPKSHNLDGAHEGWGTALKPANEPICVARKPLEKGLTVAENVIKWGTGALNIDGSRIGTDLIEQGRSGRLNQEIRVGNPGTLKSTDKSFATGRWPANILFDEEAAALLDEQSGLLQSRPNKNPRPKGKFTFVEQKEENLHRQQYETTKGGASRFFYVAKASKSERNAGLEEMPKKTLARSNAAKAGHEHDSNGFNKIQHVQNNHPTVKPIKLMSYLIKLVTPPNGIVLDPFMGSGSTGVAAHDLGFGFIGVEVDKEYFKIAEKRIEASL